MSNFTQIVLFLLLIICIIVAAIIINIRVKYKYGGSQINPPPSSMSMSYTISGEGNGLDYSIFRKMFEENAAHSGINWIEKPVSEKVNISFGSFGGFFNKKSNKLNLSPDFYKQSASIKNVLDGHSGFINKTELYGTFKRLIPNGIKYLPITYTIREFERTILGEGAFPKGHLGEAHLGKAHLGKAFPKGLAILKKNFSCKQQGVLVIASMSDYHNAKKELEIKEDGIISEYIIDPLTIKGKKFHLRIYFLLSNISGITRCSTHAEYRILTAKEKYKHGDWLNPDIHISGGHNTEIRYIFPDDIDKMENADRPTLLENLSHFNHTVCLALASSGVKNYPESNAGYQMYGADVLITKDLTPMLIEINKHPGYDQYGQNAGWPEFITKFSTNLFQFILSNVVFPYFGLYRQPHSMVEFIGNGALSPFGSILQQYKLIPITYATKHEIAASKYLHFYNKSSYEPYNIFLIEDEKTTNDIIGFIAITIDFYLKIAIIEEYQHRGIATAMIAQIIGIQCARNYTAPHMPIIKIKKKNEFLNKIAIKLHFIYNKNKREFERRCQ